MAELMQETNNKKRQAIEMGVLVLLLVVFLTVSLITHNPFGPDGERFDSDGNPLSRSGAIGLIVAAGLTLVMYSFLYRDNPLYKIAENLYVGVGLGYLAIITWRTALRPEIYEPLLNSPTTDAFLDALLHRSVPIILGVLLLTRLSRKHGWLSRYSYGLMIGWGAGLGIPLVTHSYILQQLKAAISPFQSDVAGSAAAADLFTGTWWLGVFLPMFGAVVVMVGTVSVLYYFFFSVKQERVGKAVSKVGILFLMVSFGASFGYTVMGRVSLLIGRVQFLLFDWLKMAK